MAPIFCRAYDASFTRKNILKGFEASGVSPLNTDIFYDEDFAPAAVFAAVSESPAVAAAVPKSPEACSSAFLNIPKKIRPLPQPKVYFQKIGRKKGHKDFN